MTGSPAFSFSVTTEITFGIGARHGVGTATARFGQRAALVASRHGFADSPLRADIEVALRDAGVEVVYRRAPAGEPTLEVAMETGRQLRDADAQAVIAIGGGSALDLAKAAAIAALGSVDLRQLASGERFESAALPVVALPTTAGSGAEASRAAIVLDEAAGRKRGIRGRGVAPRVALVDPELVASSPASVTCLAGFDAVAHAVETAVSRASSPVTRLLSVESLGGLLRALPRSLDDPGDLAARSTASYAAMLMGINLANSTTCLPHRMQYPVGALTGSEHARGVAALMPAWLSRTMDHAPDRLAALAGATGRATGDVHHDASAVVDAVLGLLARLRLQPRLRALGVKRRQLYQLAEMVEGSVENDPGPSDSAAILALYEASF